MVVSREFGSLNFKPGLRLGGKRHDRQAGYGGGGGWGDEAGGDGDGASVGDGDGVGSGPGGGDLPALQDGALGAQHGDGVVLRPGDGQTEAAAPVGLGKENFADQGVVVDEFNAGAAGVGWGTP